MVPVDAAQLQRRLDSQRPEDRAALLDFARRAPLVYGWWRAWKRLFKQAESRRDAELSGILLGRIDAAAFPAVAPAAAKNNPVHIENVVSLAVRDEFAYVLKQSRQRNAQNVLAYDLSDPSEPRQVGGTTITGAVRLCLDGPRLLVFTAGSWRESAKLYVFDVSTPGLFVTQGVFDVPNASGAEIVNSRLYLLNQNSYGSEHTGLAIDDLTTPLGVQKRGGVALDNPTGLAVSGGQAVVLWRRNYQLPMQMSLIDVSDPDQPKLKQSLAVPGALGAVVHGNYAFVTYGSGRLYYGQTAGEQDYGLRVYRLSSGFLVAVGLKPPQVQEVASLPLGNVRSVVIRGNYAYVCVSHLGSHRTKNLRAGGLRVFDITDPEQPRLAGSADGFDAQDVQIHGTTAYVGVGDDAASYYGYYGGAGPARTVRLVDIADPANPVMVGASPSRETFGYLKRRARRTLCQSAKTDADAFVERAYRTLIESGRGRDALDFSAQWVSCDLLFGGDDTYRQQSHGRGAYRAGRPTLSRRTRHERRPDAWDARLDLASGLLAEPHLPWQTQEAALKMLQAHKHALPTLTPPGLVRLLNSPSPFLVLAAARQTTVQLTDGVPFEPATVADAFYFGNAAQRRRIADALARQSKPAWWGPKFAQSLFTRATGDLGAGGLSRRQAGAAVYAARQHPEDIPAELLRPVFGAVLSAGRPELTAWALGAVRRVKPADAVLWLAALEGATGDVRAAALAALRDGLREMAFGYPAAWALVQAESAWVREQGWALLARSRTEAVTLARVWGELLDSPQETPALETAFASPDALDLLRQARLDGEALAARLESRPFLVRLLSGAAFSQVVRTVPAAVSLRLVAAMPDEQWLSARFGFVQALGESQKLADFWRAAWAVIGEDGDALAEARLLNDPAVSGSFLAIDDPAFLETTTNPVFDSLLGLWAAAHEGLFLKDSPLLLAAAAHSLPAVRAWGLARAQAVGMGLPFALRLLESELPASVGVGRAYFESAGAADAMTAALALCDSPKASVRAWGRGFVDRRWSALPQTDLLQRLSENPDPQTQAFLAAKLREAPDTPGVEEFDRQVLRARDRARRAKELVKARRDRPRPTPPGGPARHDLDTATLLELARSRTPRDAEWALGQLALLALDGQAVEGLTLDGPAGI